MWSSLQEVLKEVIQNMGIPVLAATVQLYLSDRKYTFFHHFMAVLMALLAAHIADAICDGFNVDPDMKLGIIAVSAYAAPHLLGGIDSLGEKWAKNPMKVISELIKSKRG